MRDDSTTQCWLFEELAKRPVTVRFDQERGSSDGGAVLLGAADRRLGLSEALSSCIRDSRDPERVRHEMPDLVRQRVYGIACGYPDGNDAARLASDPVHKLLARTIWLPSPRSADSRMACDGRTCFGWPKRWRSG